MTRSQRAKRRRRHWMGMYCLVGCISHRTLYGAVMGARRAYSKSQVRRWLAEGLGSEFPF
jgi:hypothetical protein